MKNQNEKIIPNTIKQLVDVSSVELDNVTGGCACGNAACSTNGVNTNGINANGINGARPFGLR